MGPVGINCIQIFLEDQEKTTFTCSWGTFSYRVLPFGLCNVLTTFQKVVLSIFSDLVHNNVEIYMDGFTSCGNTFQESLFNLENVFKICKQMNLSLRNEMCLMLMSEGTVLGHHISLSGNVLNSSKVNIIQNMLAPPKIERC